MQNSKLNYNHQEIESRWQKTWENEKIFSPKLETAKNPYYNLMMFPYPSAEGLHVGNMYAFTGADVYARFNRMQGKDVFEPIGLDGFGIHSENYALKVGRHPKEQAKASQENYYRQLRSIGNSFDWTRTVETYDPLFYRWTQWLFVKLFQAGLAYRKTAEVNWCPKDLTVLSDEQVIDGSCERCGSKVERRDLEQWFFRITNYAERLLENIEGLDWSDKVKIAQRNWIGKSEGLIFRSPVRDTKLYIDTFSAHFEAFKADTFVVIAPDHPFLDELIEGIENKDEIKDFCRKLLEKRKTEKHGEEKEPEGIFTGRYIVDPVGNGELPIWVANYALKDYGTGIVKCSAHDTRDFAFAKKYGIRLKAVLFPEDPKDRKMVDDLEVCYTDMKNGILIEPEEFNERKAGDVREEVIKYVQDHDLAKPQANYHLRDWLISRQRYWGPPIPMIFCETCSKSGKGEKDEMPGWYSVPEADLPVLLPDVEDWRPMGTGLSPLANHPEFYEVKCPSCGSKAKRETDVSDTFLDSAWYFLGYISDIITGDPQTQESISRDIKVDHKDFTPWDKNVEKTWLPVKKYIGGAEHSVLHLLYSRFISMVLYDLKLTSFEEPFSSFYAHGLIIKDGAKMSKSKGNVVVPDEYIAKYGADTLRAYLMFLGPFSDGGDFRDSGIEGMNRFIKRVWNMFSHDLEDKDLSNEGMQMMHKTIKKVTEEVAAFKYNTALAALMEWYNFLSAHEEVYRAEAEVFLKLIAPFAPFMTEELWQRLEHKAESTEIKSIHLSVWPTFDEKYLESNEVTVIIQVNGKRRAELVVPSAKSLEQSEVEPEARNVVAKYLENEPKKVVFVPGKIINFVV